MTNVKMGIQTLLVCFLGVLSIRISQQQTTDNLCNLPPETGPCRALIRRYFYNSEAGECQLFNYGGCEANENNFETIEACQSACPGVAIPRESDDICMLTAETGMCRAYMPSFFYNSTSEKCEGFIYGGCGGNGNRFTSLQECADKCEKSSTVTGNLCLLKYEVGHCRASFRRYYYSSDSGACEEFIYGGCGGNMNNFNTLEECEKSCKSSQEGDPCQMAPQQGPCKALIWQYYYIPESRKCNQFAYGGCGGNANRFASQEECEALCLSDSAQPFGSIRLLVLFCSTLILLVYAF